VFRAEGPGGLATTLKSTFDYGKLVRSKWFGTILLLAPMVYALTTIRLWFAGHWGWLGNKCRDLALAAVMFLLAIGEEAF
jgi:hypothetical protein